MAFTLASILTETFSPCLINIEHYKGALSFANTLGNAKVLKKSDKEEITYLMYCIKLEDIIKELETRLKVKSF